jgi:hypothetical protein
MVFTVNMENLKEIIQEEEIKDTRSKLEKFEKLFDIMKDFFKKRKIIIYGGAAMNMHLPKEHKIYTDDDFPDFDCFSCCPKKDAEDLSNLFAKNNYKYIEIKYAIHDGTYKIYVDFEPICDITKLSKKNHAILFKQASLIDGYYVTSVRHLKSASYLELAIPKSSLFRWQKVIQRIKLMENEFRNNKSSFSMKSLQFISFNDKVNKCIKEMTSYAIENNLVLAGNTAIQYYLSSDNSIETEPTSFMLTNSSGVFQCLSDDMKTTVDKLKKCVEKHNFKNIQVKEEHQDFITPYTKIYVTYFDDKYTFERIKLNLCTVYSANEHCYSYVKESDKRVVSIFFLLHIMYHSLYIKEEDIDRVNIKNIINTLIKKINVNHFKTECYGTEVSMNEIRRKRWDDKKPVVLLRMN